MDSEDPELRVCAGGLERLADGIQRLDLAAVEPAQNLDHLVGEKIEHSPYEVRLDVIRKVAVVAQDLVPS
jgi:hypothetical protein